MNPPDSCASVPCRHLRNKEMYYIAPGDDDDLSGGACWCAKSQETFGPDGEPTGKTECCAGRVCYVA